MTKTRGLVTSALIASTLLACTDLPDYDDPRDLPLEEEEFVSCQNLIPNGDFDYSPLAWKLEPSDIRIDERELPSDHPFSASSGSYFAWFGGSLGTTKIASQKIAVPRKNTLRFDGKAFVAAVTRTGPVEDTMKVEIVDETTGKVLVTLASFTNLDSVPENASFAWRDLRIEFSSQAFAGRSVIVRLTSVTDQVNNSNFLFDSLAIKPTGCL